MRHEGLRLRPYRDTLGILTIGYGRASRIVEEMAAAGILGEHKGSQAREPTITLGGAAIRTSVNPSPAVLSSTILAAHSLARSKRLLSVGL